MSEPVTAAEVQCLAEVIGLPVEAEVLAALAEQLSALLAAARLFTDFPLPEDVASAPVFHP
jgi:hypothetical protein